MPLEYESQRLKHQFNWQKKFDSIIAIMFVNYLQMLTLKKHSIKLEIQNNLDSKSFHFPQVFRKIVTAFFFVK